MTSSESRKRRGRFDIIKDILYTASQGGVVKTRIMYGAGLSYPQLEEYLLIVLDSNLLKKIEGNRDIYSITTKGLEYLGVYDRLKRLLTKQGSNSPYADKNH